MEPVNQSFVDLLEELRITKVQLSKDLAISRQTTDNITNGTFLPSLKIIYRALEAYPWLNPGWLITNEGSMRKVEDNGQEGMVKMKIEMLESTISELRRTVEAQEITIELLNEYRKNNK